MLIHILNGLVYGGLLYLVAVGLVLIFGLRQVVNFAHGSLFMVGAYVGYAITNVAGFWVGIVVSIMVLSVLGVILDRLVFRPLQNQNPIVTVLVTFGLLLVLEDVVKSIWGKDFLTVRAPDLVAGTVEIAGADFPVYRLMVILVAVLVAGGLTVWLRSSRIGLYVRASSADPVTTGTMGVDTERVSAIVVAIGAGLAGLSGTIASPLLALSPSMGGSILIESFIVVVVGGLGSFSGAFIAALVIGQLQNMGIVFVPNISSMIPFLLMIGVLIWKPAGFAGGAVAEGGAVHVGGDPEGGGTLRKRTVGGIALVLAIGGCLLAVTTSTPLFLSLMTQALLSALLATGVGFLLRQNGLVSFGHALFYGAGGYILGIAAVRQLMPLELATIVALVVPTAFAFLLGLLIVRIPGVAFSMLTLAFAQAFYQLLLKWRTLANGDDGLAIAFPREIFGIPVATLQQPQVMFVICWFLLAGVLVGLWLLTRSRFGLLTLAIRENEERARFIGYKTLVPRALVYAISAGLCALAGVLAAFYNGFVSPENLHWSLSGAALVMAIIGGTRAVWGPALGAVVFFFFKEVVGDVTEYWPALIGATLIVVTVFFPMGLSGLIGRLAQGARLGSSDRLAKGAPA